MNAPSQPTMERDLTVAVLFDTAGFLRTLPMTGAATRTAKLNRWLHHQGSLTTLLLCDLNPDSRPSGTWPLPVRYLPYETVYEHPDRLQLHGGRVLAERLTGVGVTLVDSDVGARQGHGHG